MVASALSVVFIFFFSCFFFCYLPLAFSLVYLSVVLLCLRPCCFCTITRIHRISYGLTWKCIRFSSNDVHTMTFHLLFSCLLFLNTVKDMNRTHTTLIKTTTIELFSRGVFFFFTWIKFGRVAIMRKSKIKHFCVPFSATQNKIQHNTRKKYL